MKYIHVATLKFSQKGCILLIGFTLTNARTFKVKWPIDGTEKIIRVEFEYYDFLNISRPNRFLNLFTVYEVLNNPNRIFAGLKRPFSDSSKRLCVVGKPRYWYVGKENSSEVPFPSELVYLVFLSERNSVFEFGAEDADQEDPLSPVNYETRYGEILWKKTS